jgi:hypothetical protein
MDAHRRNARYSIPNRFINRWTCVRDVVIASAANDTLPPLSRSSLTSRSRSSSSHERRGRVSPSRTPRGQELDFNARLVCQGHSVREALLEFAHVAWPRMTQEGLSCFRADEGAPRSGAMARTAYLSPGAASDQRDAIAHLDRKRLLPMAPE